MVVDVVAAIEGASMTEHAWAAATEVVEVAAEAVAAAGVTAADAAAVLAAAVAVATATTAETVGVDQNHVCVASQFLVYHPRADLICFQFILRSLFRRHCCP